MIALSAHALSRQLAVPLAVLCALGGSLSPLSASPDSDERAAAPAVIRLLPPTIDRERGRAEIETLVLESRIASVQFLVDGELAERRRAPPFSARIQLATPPRPQVVRVEALDGDGRRIGTDELTVNRVRRRLAVTIRGVDRIADGFTLDAALSWPEEVSAEQVTVELNDSRVATLEPSAVLEGTLTLAVDRPHPKPEDFVRVALRLADGRSVEDVELVDRPAFHADVAVHLVQLQLVATEKTGRVVDDLRADELELHEGREVRPIAGLFHADDVSLVLGLAIDASGSMQAGWARVQEAAVLFLRSSVRPQDRGFVVDFDTDLRLRQGVTGDLGELVAALDGLEPEGGTALYDSILFSLLQFQREPGRRGLVVLTDGLDGQSLTDPRWTVEAGRRLGVPVYVIAVDRVPIATRGGGFSAAAAEVASLHLLTDPTGGRLFRAPSLDGVRRALVQIQSELRGQLIATYYSETDPEEPLPEIVVSAPGRKGLHIKAVPWRDGV